MRKCRASRKCLSVKAYVRFEPSRFTQPSDIQHHIVISSPLCVFRQISVNVQVNMVESRNGQSRSEREQSKSKGRFTGERLLRDRPRIYRRVVELLAEPGMSVNQITKFCRVSEHTVRAVRGREAISIAERKQRLISIFGNVAEMSAERMEELCGKANLRDAGISAGIATDKMLALTGQMPAVNIANIWVPSEKEREEMRATDRKLDEITARLRAMDEARISAS